MKVKESNVKPQDTKTIDTVLRLLSPRWTTAILIQLSSGKKRTSGLKSALEPISSKTLNERLIALSEHGLVEKERFKESPPRVEYRLTKDGAKLLSLLRDIKKMFIKMPEKELHNWGNQAARLKVESKHLKAALPK